MSRVALLFAYQTYGNRIEACAKDGVPMFGPLLYDPPLYKHEDALKDFILAKCTKSSFSLFLFLNFFYLSFVVINAERASLKTGSFVERDVRTRSFILDSIFSKYTKESINSNQVLHFR